MAAAPYYGPGEKTLQVWDLETGRVRRFALPRGQRTAQGKSQGATGYEQGIESMTFAGESLLYTAGDGGLRRWDLARGSNELVAAAPPGYSMGGAFSTEPSRRAHVGGANGSSRPLSSIMVHDLTTGTARELTQFEACGTLREGAAALDPSGTVAATAGLDGIVRVGRVSGGEPALLVGHTGTVTHIAISPDLRWVATSGEDNTLRLWPMPDPSKPPLHALPHDELLAKLKSLTNLRVTRDESAPNGWKVEVGPFPGWKNVPTW